MTLDPNFDQRQLWFGSHRYDTFRRGLPLSMNGVRSDVCSLSLFLVWVSSCWHGWSVETGVITSRDCDWTALPDNTKTGVGFYHRSCLDPAMLLPGQLEKGENDEKSISFLSRLRLSDPLSSYFLFGLMPSIKGRYECLIGLHAWAFQWIVPADSRLMLTLSETSSGPFCQPWLRQWLEPLEPFISTKLEEEVRTFALYQQIFLW